jgi:radical SAM superfamily enzyme YgiQ (UPF0313 family)
MKYKKILLMNPPVCEMLETELPLFINKNLGILPHLGLLYLISSFRKYKIKVNFLDCLERRMSYFKLFSYIKDYQPDFVGIMTITHNILTVLKVIEIIKEASPKTHINLGGPHVTLFPYETLKLNGADSITVGDGEIVLPEFILGNRLKGIYLKDDINQDLKPAVINDLDILDFPTRDLLLYKKYSYVLSGKRKVATMISSRGCPFNCSFCLVPNFKFRRRSVENVIAEVDYCIKLGYQEIYFVDDTFNSNIDWLKEFCKQIKKRDILWSFRGRINNLDEELIRELKESKCIRIHFGIETSSEEGLKLLRKNIKMEEIEKVIKLCKKYKIETCTYFLIGCPHEKKVEQIWETINFAIKLNPDYCLFNILTIYPKTELYKLAIGKNILDENYWQRFIKNPYKDFQLPFWEENIKREELLKLLKKAYFKFYFSPGMVYKIFKSLWRKR